MSGTTLRRVMKELKDLQKNPIKEFTLHTVEDSALVLHFTMMGPLDSPYQDGIYHGRILIPSEYPFAPPDVVMLTPSGRFEVGKKVCLSVSSYHPERWKATWGIATVIHALRDHMATSEKLGIGAVDYPNIIRVKMAGQSRDFVCKECGAVVASVWDTIMKDAPPATDVDVAAKLELLASPAQSPQSSPSAAGMDGRTPSGWEMLPTAAAAASSSTTTTTPTTTTTTAAPTAAEPFAPTSTVTSTAGDSTSASATTDIASPQQGNAANQDTTIATTTSTTTGDTYPTDEVVVKTSTTTPATTTTYSDVAAAAASSSPLSPNAAAGLNATTAMGGASTQQDAVSSTTLITDDTTTTTPTTDGVGIDNTDGNEQRPVVVPANGANDAEAAAAVLQQPAAAPPQQPAAAARAHDRHMRVERRGRRVQVHLSISMIDAWIYRLVALVAIILLKKLLLDNWTETARVGGVVWDVLNAW